MGQRARSHQRTRRGTLCPSHSGTDGAFGTRHIGSRLPGARTIDDCRTGRKGHRPAHQLRAEHGRPSLGRRNNCLGARAARVSEGCCIRALGPGNSGLAQTVPESLAALDERAALMAGRKLNGSRRSHPAACLPLRYDSTNSTNLVLSSSTAGGSRAETNTASSYCGPARTRKASASGRRSILLNT